MFLVHKEQEVLLRGVYASSHIHVWWETMGCAALRGVIGKGLSEAPGNYYWTLGKQTDFRSGSAFQINIKL
jgi:hypothetical protein